MANVIKNTGTKVCKIYKYKRFIRSINLIYFRGAKLTKKATLQQKRDS